MSVVSVITLGFILVQIPSPTSKPEQPVVKNGKSNNKANQRKHSSPLIAPTTPTSPPMSQPTATPKQDEDQGEADQAIYRVKVVSQPFDWLYLVYVSITAIAAFFAWRALLAIRDQGRLMKDQLIEIRKTRQRTVAEMQSAGTQTQELIGQATAQAGALKTASDAALKSADALILSERPWVLVTLKKGFHERIELDGRDQSQGGKNIMYFEWFLTNHGKTPALVYEIFAFFDLMPLKAFNELRENGFPPDAKPLRPDAFIVAPNAPHQCPGVKKYWTIEERKAEDTMYVAHGIVKYRDVITGDAHETPFLSYYVFAEDFHEGEFRRVYDAPAYKKYT